MVTFSKMRAEAIVAGSELSDTDLEHVVGGFNPQPDPPATLVSQTRVTPNDFGIRARQIAD